MRLYFDSSYLFRLYSNEFGADDVRRLATEAEIIVSAWHARAEMAAIFLRKRWEKAYPDADLAESRDQFFDELGAGVIRLLTLDEAVMQCLESVMQHAPRATFLRAADALHLACAAAGGFTEVYSNDRHFLAAAPLFGLKGINIIAQSNGERK